MDFIWGLSGDVREGEIISFISDTLPILKSSRDGIRFRINTVHKHEDGKMELQGLTFYGTEDERPAILVLDKDYDDWYETRCVFDSVGVLTIQS